MCRQLGQVVQDHPQVQHALYIDDGGQYSSGKMAGIVGRHLVAAAVAFMRMAQVLCLRLFIGDMGKSVLVTNSQRVASIVRKHLSYVGETINIQCTTKDLWGVAGRRRRAPRQLATKHAERWRTAILAPSVAK